MSAFLVTPEHISEIVKYAKKMAANASVNWSYNKSRVA